MEIWIIAQAFTSLAINGPWSILGRLAILRTICVGQSTLIDTGGADCVNAETHLGAALRYEDQARHECRACSEAPARRYAACSAIACSISSRSLVSSSILAAPITPSTCSGLRTPTIAPVTAGFCNVQAMAISAGGHVEPLADGAQRLHQTQIAGKRWFPEVFAPFSPIVFGNSRNPLARHGAAQQTGSHG